MDSFLGIREHECAGAVDDVDALGTRVDHDPGLLGERSRRRLVAEHEETDGLHAQVSRRTEVLDRDVRLGAVRRDPGH